MACGVSLALGVRARDPARGFTRWQEHQGRRPIVPVVGVARHGDWCASHSGGGGGACQATRVIPRRRECRDTRPCHGGDDGDDGDDDGDDGGGTGSESTSRDDERLEEKRSTSDTTDDDDDDDDDEGCGGERRSDGRWGECG